MPSRAASGAPEAAQRAPPPHRDATAIPSLPPAARRPPTPPVSGESASGPPPIGRGRGGSRTGPRPLRWAPGRADCGRTASDRRLNWRRCRAATAAAALGPPHQAAAPPLPPNARTPRLQGRATRRARLQCPGRARRERRTWCSSRLLRAPRLAGQSEACLPTSGRRRQYRQSCREGYRALLGRKRGFARGAALWPSRRQRCSPHVLLGARRFSWELRRPRPPPESGRLQ